MGRRITEGANVFVLLARYRLRSSIDFRIIFLKLLNFVTMKAVKQKFIILATIIVLLNGIMLVSCQKESVTETWREQTEASSLRVSQDPNAEAMLYIDLLKKLARDDHFVSFVKSYYENRSKEETFDYIVPLSELFAEYDKNVGGMEKLLRKYLNEAQYSAVVSGLRGIEFQGKTLVPELNIFYYDKQFKDFARWNGKFVEEILYNYLEQGKFYGYEISGKTNVYDERDTQIEGKILAQARWVFQWDDISNGDNEKPIVSCHCWDNTDGLERPECVIGGEGGWCGVSIFGSGCAGFCRYRGIGISTL